MNRNTRTAVVVAIAVVVAALASFGVYRAIEQMPVREVEVRSLYQVVAAMDMPMGTLITKDHVKLVAWPASSPVSKGFTTIESVLNRGLIASVSRQRTADRNEARAARSGRRPAALDYRGHARRFREGERGHRRRRLRRAGHARRRDGHAQARDDEGQHDARRRQRREVLTAGTRYDQEKARDGQPIPTRVVTLLVTPPDAERIALAASEGEVMLTLRNPMDRKPTETTGIRTAALLGQPPAPPPVVAVNRPRPAVAEPVAAARPRCQGFTRSRPSGPRSARKRSSVNAQPFLVCVARSRPSPARRWLLAAALVTLGRRTGPAAAAQEARPNSRACSSRRAAPPSSRPTSTSPASRSRTRRSPMPWSWSRAKF